MLIMKFCPSKLNLLDPATKLLDPLNLLGPATELLYSLLNIAIIYELLIGDPYTDGKPYYAIEGKLVH